MSFILFNKTNYNTNMLPTTYYSTHSLGIKSNLFADQTSSGRLQRIKNKALENTKKSWEKTYPIKNNIETTTSINALNRVRNKGYIVPPKITQKNVLV